MSDAERFTELYGEHYVAVLRYLRRRLPEDLALEAVDETFLICWRRLDEVPAGARAWLFTTARHQGANLNRTRNRRDALTERVLENTAPATHDHSDGVGERAHIRSALALLGDDDRELLTLVAWDGLSTREAAEVLELSVSTTTVRLHRARKRFRHALDVTDRHAPAPEPARSSARRATTTPLLGTAPHGGNDDQD